MKSKLTRKQFFETSLVLASATVGLAALTSCSDDDGDGGAAGTGGTSGQGGSGGKGGTGGSSGTGTGGSGGSATGGSSGTSTGTGGSSAGVTSCDASLAMTLNHTHTLAVPAADVAAGVEKTYTTGPGGDPAHMHMVTVTAAEFATLAGGGTVTHESAVELSHTHTVTIMCA